MNRSSLYREMSVNTASPVQMVVMLYEGAVKFLNQAIEDIERKDYARKSQSVDRAVAIIQHLQGTLDFEKGGDISRELGSLYNYITSRIFAGSSQLDREALEEATKLLTILLEGWREIALKDQEQTVPVDLLAQNAAGRFELRA